MTEIVGLARGVDLFVFFLTLQLLSPLSLSLSTGKQDEGTGELGVGVGALGREIGKQWGEDKGIPFTECLGMPRTQGLNPFYWGGARLRGVK